MHCKMIFTNFLRTSKNIEDCNVTKASKLISNLVVLTEIVDAVTSRLSSIYGCCFHFYHDHFPFFRFRD